MKRSRKKEDYRGAILVRDGEVTRRAAIVVVRGNDVYVIQPHTEIKVSYHALGRYHLKVGRKGRAVVPIQRTPPALVEKAEDIWGMTMANFARMPIYGGESYDRTVTLDIEDLPRRRLSLAFAIGRDFRGWKEQYLPNPEGTDLAQYVLRNEAPRICILVRTKCKRARLPKLFPKRIGVRVEVGSLQSLYPQPSY